MDKKDYWAKQLSTIKRSLEKWKGGTLKLWDYSVSHKVLALRITFTEKPGNLHIGCGDVTYICCPASWTDVDLDVEVRQRADQEDEYCLSDHNGEYFVICGVIEIKEDVK